MHVYAYVCIYVWTYTHLYPCECIHTFVCIAMCMCIFVWVYTHVYLAIHVGHTVK